MATSKTLTPTNVTIQIPDFTDRPDQRVTNNCIDKEADAINALNSNLQTVDGKLELSDTTSFRVIQNSGHTLFVLRANFSGTGNYIQLIINSSTKQLQIAKSISGTETVLATFQGT